MAYTICQQHVWKDHLWFHVLLGCSKLVIWNFVKLKYFPVQILIQHLGLNQLGSSCLSPMSIKIYYFVINISEQILYSAQNHKF